MSPYFPKWSRSFSAGPGRGCEAGHRRPAWAPARSPSLDSQAKPPRKSLHPAGLHAASTGVGADRLARPRGAPAPTGPDLPLGGRPAGAGRLHGRLLCSTHGHWSQQRLGLQGGSAVADGSGERARVSGRPPLFLLGHAAPPARAEPPSALSQQLHAHPAPRHTADCCPQSVGSVAALLPGRTHMLLAQLQPHARPAPLPPTPHRVIGRAGCSAARHRQPGRAGARASGGGRAWAAPRPAAPAPRRPAGDGVGGHPAAGVGAFSGACTSAPSMHMGRSCVLLRRGRGGAAPAAPLESLSAARACPLRSRTARCRPPARPDRPARLAGRPTSGHCVWAWRGGAGRGGAAGVGGSAGRGAGTQALAPTCPAARRG